MQSNSQRTQVDGPRLLIGSAQIGRFVGVSAVSVGRLVRHHALPVTKIGKALVASPAQIVRWIERRAEGATDA